MVKWLFTESTFLEFESWLATFTYSQLFLDIAFTVQVEVIFLMCKLYLFLSEAYMIQAGVFHSSGYTQLCSQGW